MYCTKIASDTMASHIFTNEGLDLPGKIASDMKHTTTEQRTGTHYSVQILKLTFHFAKFIYFNGGNKVCVLSVVLVEKLKLDFFFAYRIYESHSHVIHILRNLLMKLRKFLRFPIHLPQSTVYYDKMAFATQ